MSQFMTADTMLISQKPTFVEMTNESDVADENAARWASSGRKGGRPARSCGLITSVDHI